MGIDFDITSSDAAYRFLLDALDIYAGNLIMEYTVECNNDEERFWERNKHRLKHFDVHDVRFVAFHVTGSLDDCCEIRQSGIRNLQYVLSHSTILSRLLHESGISFDVDSRIMRIGEVEYNVDYDYHRECGAHTKTDSALECIAHRLYYDYCVDGFFSNDNVESYGTEIHKRPEFLIKLISLSPSAKKYKISQCLQK